MIGKIKQAILKTLIGDSSAYPKAIASYKGKDTQCVRQSVYGVSSQPPTSSLGLLFKIENMGGVHYGIFDYPTGRFKNLEAGEVQVGNYLTQASIKFDKDGNVTINVPSGNLNLNVTGNINANVTGNMDFTASGNIDFSADTVNMTTINGLSIDGIAFDTHVHDENDSGGPTDGPRNP